MNREQAPASSDLSESKTLPFTILPIIREANAAFNRDLPELLRAHEDEWVAYHGSRRVGFGKTQLDLHRRCLAEGLEDGTFIVYRIEVGADDDYVGMVWEK